MPILCPCVSPFPFLTHMLSLSTPQPFCHTHLTHLATRHLITHLSRPSPCIRTHLSCPPPCIPMSPIFYTPHHLSSLYHHMHLPSPPCPYFTPIEPMFLSSPLILSHTSLPPSCVHSSLIHAWNLAYPAAHHTHAMLISIGIPKPPHLHAWESCMHGHPPRLPFINTYPSFQTSILTHAHHHPHTHAYSPHLYTLALMSMQTFHANYYSKSVIL